MPRKLRRPCAEPGCGALTRSTRCEHHAGVSTQRYDKWRGTAHERGYNAAWRRIRERKLRLDPLCQLCKSDGRVTVGQMVHHILPLSEGGTHAMENLATSCFSCHEKLHDRTTGAVEPLSLEGEARDGWVFS